MENKPWYKSYAPGVPHTLTFEPITLSGALTRSAGKYAAHTALNYMGKKLSYRDLNDQVDAFARVLRRLGVKPGDKVAVCLPNIPQVVIANYATFRLGAVAVQNNPLYTERELAYQLNDSDAKILITLSLLVPRIERIWDQTKLEKLIACHIQTYLPFPKRQLFPFVKKEMHRKIEKNERILCFEEQIGGASGEAVEDRSRWDDLAALIYTGGTTGVSKGVMLTNANLSSNVQQFSAWFPDLNIGAERIVGNFPIFHSAGFTAIQNFCIWQGFENIMVPRPEPKINIDIIKKYKPTFLPGVPTIFIGLLADPDFRKLNMKSIRGFFSGAAPLAADTIRELKNLTGADMCEVYGATETSPIVSVTPWGGRIKPGTVGCPAPDTDIRIVDVETGKKEMPIGETGEIIISGPQVMQGYYKKPRETAEALRNGWYFTGDIGRFDEDGYLTIVDRKKDMVIAGGYNIYPVEVDNVLFDHPNILEGCSVGIPDAYRGETLKAFVVIKEGESLTEKEVIDYCRERLAPYKVPRQVEFVTELPKSAVGKVLRRKLKEMELEKMQKAAPEAEKN